jgi:hypothetical protein
MVASPIGTAPPSIFTTASARAATTRRSALPPGAPPPCSMVTPPADRAPPISCHGMPKANIAAALTRRTTLYGQSSSRRRIFG